MSGATIEAGTLDDGPRGSVLLTLAQDACYTLALSSGDHSFEVSWTLGGMLSGGAPSTTGFFLQGGALFEGCNVPSPLPTVSQIPTTAGPTLAPTLSAAPTFRHRFTVITGACTARELCVTSPNYPSAYGQDQICTIVANFDGVLNVSKFDLQFDAILCSNCDCDALTVNEGARFCGTDGPHAVAVQAGATMVFKSDGDTDGSGFEICMDPSNPTSSPTTAMPSYGPTAEPTVKPSISLAPTNSLQVAFHMVDSFGDGWNNAVASLTAWNSSTILQTLTLNSGKTGTDTMLLSYGTCYTLSLSSGSYPSEITWTLGDSAVTGGAPSITEFNVVQVVDGADKIHEGCFAPTAGTSCPRVRSRVGLCTF